MELSEDTLTLSRERSILDEDVIEFTNVLDAYDVEYVIVSGYVAILTSRSRSTENVDVVLEPLSRAETERLVSTVRGS